MDVFFVDASPASRRRLTAMLEDLEAMRVVGHASKAKAAIAAILEKLPDVVLLDLRLEEGAGLDVLREVRRREPGIDFYVLSNYASEPYRRCALRMGAVEFFDKTTELETLRELLAERALTRRPAVPL